MKRNALLLSVIVAAAVATAAVAVEHPMRTDSGWFDLQNCVFCENLLKDPDLLPHMTWESHKFAGGMVQIFTVPAEHKESYVNAMKAMETIGNDLMSGKTNPMATKMCGSCAAYGQLMMAGATSEYVPGDAADVAIVTADDPALVAKIHEYCDRNNKEMALMMGGAHGEHSHEHAH